MGMPDCLPGSRGWGGEGMVGVAARHPVSVLAMFEDAYPLLVAGNLLRSAAGVWVFGDWRYLGLPPADPGRKLGS